MGTKSKIKDIPLYTYDKYDNINFMLERPEQFNQTGRAQGYEQSLNIDIAILDMFRDEKIPFYHLKAPSIKEDPLYVSIDDAFEYIQKRKKRDGNTRS